MTEDFLKLLVHAVSFLNFREKIKLLKAISNEDEFLKLDKSDLENIIGRKIRANFSASRIFAFVKRDLQYIERKGIKCLCIDDENYPLLLKQCSDPPFLLFLIGEYPKNSYDYISVIGTRKPTRDAVLAAKNIGRECVNLDLCLVSGLAMGIDSFAQQGVLERNGRTWAVLGNPIGDISPKYNKEMSMRIVRNGGGLLSEYFPSEEYHKSNFALRNRIVACMSMALLVIEAPLKSGTMITVKVALNNGRDVYVHKVGVSDKLEQVSEFDQYDLLFKNEDTITDIELKCKLGSSKLYLDGAKGVLSVKEILDFSNIKKN